MKHIKRVLTISTILLIIFSLLIMRMININNNDMMSTNDKVNFKLLHGYIEKDYLHAAVQETLPMDYTLSGDLTIRSHQDPMDVSLQMGISSVNSTYAIKSFSLEKENDALVIPSESDWLSPYMIKTIGADASVTASPRFTGGWHGSNGDATGQPTAFMKSYELYADGKKITGNDSGTATTIHVIVNQLVKGYNTDQFVLEEYILYTLIDNRLTIRVKAFALEDVAIETFYGLETHNKGFNEMIHYHFADGTSISKSLGIISDSGPSSSLNKVTHFSLTSTEHPFILSAHMLRTEAPTPMPILPKNQPHAFTEAYGKSYFNIINGNPLYLKTNQVFEWAGELQFSIDTVN